MLVNLFAALSSIQNGYSGKCISVPVPRTFLNFVVLNHLLEGGYIGNFTINVNNPYKYNVELKYLDSNEPALRHFKIITRPSQRVFMSAKQLRQNFSIHDFVLLQSSLTKTITYLAPGILDFSVPSKRVTGVITLKEALLNRCGGEILFSVI